jgi:hypothetical protein
MSRYSDHKEVEKSVTVQLTVAQTSYFHVVDGCPPLQTYNRLMTFDESINFLLQRSCFHGWHKFTIAETEQNSQNYDH